jgi:hypothetical protein
MMENEIFTACGAPNLKEGVMATDIHHAARYIRTYEITVMYCHAAQNLPTLTSYFSMPITNF